MLPLFQKATDQNFSLMQTRWKSELDPILTNPLLEGVLLKNIALANGATVVNHFLGRVPLGYIIVDIDNVANIYRSQPFNDLSLTLASNAAVTVSLWVF